MFAVEVSGLDISAIEIDKESDAYVELMSVTKDITKKRTEAELLNYEEQLRIQREEGQYAMHMSTRQQNLGAYQTEKNSEVGIAGVNALGKMGENGVGNVSLGGGSGLNPMTMMAGMALGSAVGQNIAGVMNGAMNPSANMSNQPGAAVPPPVPESTYFLAKDGKPTGPYNIQTLTGMLASGEFKGDSLVWKQGMPEWQRADSQPDLKGMFPPAL